MNYEEVVKQIEAGGFFAEIRRFADGWTDLVCNSARTGTRNHGNSFRVERGTQSGEWFVATWSPVYYRVPDPAQVPAVCLTALASSRTPVFEVPTEIIDRFSLEEVSEEDFFAHHGKRWENDPWEDEE